MKNDTLSFTVDLAREAGALLKEYFRVDGVASSIKPDRSLVTRADIEADELIRSAIHKGYPDDGILSEEESTYFPEGFKNVWVIDPLDGTTNYSLGLHYWGVSIARFRDGQPQFSVVYFPIMDEMFAAQRGQGATLNGEKHTVPDPQENAPASFFAHCSRTCKRYHVEIPYKRRSLGAAAYHICTVAKGSAIISLEVTPKLWDIAGAWLVVEEAGGSITTLAGGEPFPALTGVDYQYQPYTTLAAANPDLLDQAQKGLIPRTEFSEFRK